MISRKKVLSDIIAIGEVELHCAVPKIKGRWPSF